MHTHGENDKTYIIHGGKRDEKCYIIPKCFYYTWQDIVRKKKILQHHLLVVLLEIIFSRYHKTLWSTALPLNMCEWKWKKNTWLTAHFAIKRKNSSGIPGMISSAVFARCKNFWVHTQMKSLFIINVMGFVKKVSTIVGFFWRRGKKNHNHVLALGSVDQV